MARFRRITGDVMALAVAAMATVYLTNRDGGFDGSLFRALPLALVLTTPMVLAELKHLPKLARYGVGVLTVGVLINAATAQMREGFLPATVTLLLLVWTASASHRLMRASWGPTALSAIVALTLLMSWQVAGYGYFGSIWSDQVARWLPLSWHNQSSILMGGTGLFALGAALKHPHKGVAFGLGTIGAMGLGTVWLSGSRGGLIAVGLGTVILLSMIRSKRELTRAGFVALGAGAISYGLSNAATVMGTLGVADRVQPAARTAQFRFDHWRAAWGMFLEDPVTGFGLGSYGGIAPQFAPPTTPLTAFAHNELVEHLGEGGLLIAIPLLLLFGAGAWITLRFMFGVGEPTTARWAAQAGAAPAFVALGSHALIDFDWAYPLLLGLFGIACGVLISARPTASMPSSWSKVAIPVALCGVLVAGVAGITRSPTAFGFEQNPLALRTQRSLAATALAEGDAATAHDIAQGALQWHSGDTTMVTLETLARADLGQATPQDVVATLTPGRSRLAAYSLVTGWLQDNGHLELAVEVADELVDLTNLYAVWQPDAAALQAWETKFLVARQLDGCDGVQEVADELEADPFINGRLDTTPFTAECS